MAEIATLILLALILIGQLTCLIVIHAIEKQQLRSHNKLIDYIHKCMKSLKSNVPEPTKMSTMIKKSNKKGRAWSPSKDVDYKMRGNLHDFF